MRAPSTAAISASGAIAAQVIGDGHASSATSCAMPEQTKKFIAMFSIAVSPCRCAAAPTTRPNTMMPGETGTPRRQPSQKPAQDQYGLSLAESIAVIARQCPQKQRPGNGPGA